MGMVWWSGSDAKSSDEEDGYDSELEEAEASEFSLLAKTDDALLKLIGFTDQKPIPTMLGKDSNALIWPRGTPDEDEDQDGIEKQKSTVHASRFDCFRVRIR